MSPRSHLRSIHKRAPEPQLLDLGLPLSLPSPVAQILHPIVQVGPSSPASSSSNQPPKQNPPQSSSSPPPSKPSPSPRPSPNPAPSQAPPSSTGGSPNNGESGGSSNDGGNGGTTNSGDNGASGNQGSQGNNKAGGNSNDQGNNNDGNGNDSSTNGNGAFTQSGTTSSSGNSNSTPQNGNDQSQSPSSSDGPATPASSTASGTGNGGTTSTQDSGGSNEGEGNSEQPLPSIVPILGEISGSNQSGGTTPQNGNSNNNSPSKTSQSQSSTGSGSGSSNNDPLVGVDGSNGNNGTPGFTGGPAGSTSSVGLPASTLAATSKSHAAGGIAAGVTVSLAAVSLIAFIVFFLRRRHQRKKAEHRVTWISGFVESHEPDMVERSSIRSSWGTPIERPSSWRRISNPFAYTTSESLPPVLPLPVHSPLAIERPGGTLSPELPENPFSDDVEAAIQETPQPLQLMTTLPIRFSLISAGSTGQDPFDDMHRTAEPVINNPDNNRSHMKLATEQRSITGHGPSQANFPLPPSTPASVKSGYAVGSISDLHLSQELLPTPSISFSFPDSPISPTFASTGTASYPRRASVKYNFRASQARSDEIHLEKGDEVNVMSVYEDGWAFVQKEKDNERGLAPLHCLDVSD